MCEDGGSYFYKNQKYRPLEIEKKILFQLISFQKILIFHVRVFSENVQCFIGTFFYIFFAVFTGKHLCWSLLPATLLKRDIKASVFL